MWMGYTTGTVMSLPSSSRVKLRKHRFRLAAFRDQTLTRPSEAATEGTTAKERYEDCKKKKQKRKGRKRQERERERKERAE